MTSSTVAYLLSLSGRADVSPSSRQERIEYGHIRQLGRRRQIIGVYCGSSDLRGEATHSGYGGEESSTGRYRSFEMGFATDERVK